MLRDIIKIDEQLCNGCGNCIPGCPEGAIQLIDGKARLVSDLSCDGLGACLGKCPLGAIEIEKREAEPYNERAVMENIVKAGPNTILAHLKHLDDHGETEFLAQALDVLKEKGIDVPREKAVTEEAGGCGGGCPGSKIMEFARKESPASVKSTAGGAATVEQESELAQWPVQLHLLNPRAPYLKGSDLLLSADCVAHAVGNFHSRFLKGKTLAIACPKLDSGLDSYLEKLTAMIDESGINTLTVMIMEVPCCGGLIALAQKAAADAQRKIPVKKIMVSVRGEIMSEEWV
ncbi:MAG: 4Fe-4S binding protein [Spirochaetales bacterium]|nr:4Fe-4S binding protein [Spirochaetales bacterium]